MRDGQRGGTRTRILRIRNPAHILLRFALMAATGGLEPPFLGSEPSVLAAERHGNVGHRAGVEPA